MSQLDHDLVRATPTPEGPAVGSEDLAPGRTTRTDGLAGPGGLRTSGILQRKAERDDNGVAAGADQAVAAAGSSPGMALPSDVSTQFGASLGADLSGVRVHTGAESAAAASAVGARAYTTGQDIHFAAGQYAPETDAGKHLLAHEVAHTVQQSGGAAGGTQYKLEVSQPGDALERAADAAADRMVAGQRAAQLLDTSMSGIGRKLFRDIDYGTLEGAGDAAAATAAKESLRIDNVSVTQDMGDVASTVSDIQSNSKVLEKASDTDIPRKQEFVATNAEAVAKLSIFKDKLNVSTVDTASFAMQYRIAYMDFQRLTAESHEILAHVKNDQSDAVGAVTDGISKTSGLKLDASVELTEFKEARKNLNTAATKMTGKLTTARGAANSLQAGIYRAQAAAAAAKEKADQQALNDIKAEIAEVAGGVGKIVKLVSTVAGFAGGGSATGAALGAVNEPGTVHIEGADVGALKGTSLGDMLEKKQDVDLDPEGRSKTAIIKAMYGDAGKLDPTGSAIMSGDPAKMAEALVTAIGEYANKSKIDKLQTDISKKAAEVKVFSAAADNLDMVGKRDTLQGASDELSTAVNAFVFAKKDLAIKSDALMAKLAAGGKKGKDQAKVVLFLGDADRFLAQVKNAISVGENQQANMKQAAEDRKNLRGTNSYEGEPDRNTQHYYRCKNVGKKEWYHAGDFYYQLTRMDVKFSGGSDDMTNPNAANQGGAGTVEGVGGAQDEVATKIDTLKEAQKKVQALQTACQNALFGAGQGEAGLNG